VTIAGTVTASSGTLTDTAAVTSGVADPASGNNSLTLRTTVDGGPGKRADLGLTASVATGTVVVGQTTSMTFTLTNHGPDAAQGVTLSGPAVPRVTLESLNVSQGTCSFQETISCNLGTLASGQVATLKINLTPRRAETSSCPLSAASSVADPSLSNNSASASFRALDPVTTPPVDPGACRIDVVPAATLLIPYFEIDLDHSNGATTLISINNAVAAPQLAQVTLWSDWGVPVLSYTVALTGYDVQTINLRDVISRGVLPPNGGGAGCPSLLVDGALPKATTDHLQAWLTGKPSPSQGNCVAPSRSGNMVTGYATIDAVNRCSSSNPTDPGYFAPGGTGIASDNNTLWGDFFLVSGDDFQAHGDPAVHIRAERSTFLNHRSFYGSFVSGSGIDDRQPLGTSYGSRYLSGGLFDGGTQLVIWRDAKVARPAAIACGQEPARMELAGTAFDEEENASAIVPSNQIAPWSTQKVGIGRGAFPVSHPFGWVVLDLWHKGGSPSGDSVAQGWVTTVLSAQKRFSIGLRAVRLDSACDF
jgi:hypothetical protein